MARRAYHQAGLTVRLVQPHDVFVEIVGRMLQVMIPSAIITITDGAAAKGMYRAMIEGRITARRVFTDPNPARGYTPARPGFTSSEQIVTAAVRLSGEQPAPMILGKAPRHSPRRRGQLAVRVGALTIVCEDRGAWESQFDGWERMHRLAVQLWPEVMATDRYARLVETAAMERMLREGGR
jgi:hypothetical protein